MDDNKLPAKTVLLIEDDAVLSKMYSQKLGSSGYNVLIARDGEEGLDIAKTADIDLVLTDIMLPRLSGTEFIQKFLKIAKNKNTPVIAWSNLADTSEKDVALKLGAKEFLVKGRVTLDEIAEVVKKYIK